MLILALLFAQADAPFPQISVTTHAEGYRADVGNFEDAQEGLVRGEIARRATDLCATKVVKWGKFGSIAKIDAPPSREPAIVSGYFQEFSCVDEEKPSYAAVPPDWKPSSADDTDVRRFFEAYYAKRDAGDFEAAAAMFQPGAAGGERSTDELRDFNRKLGLGQRRITAVTWYVNSPDAPVLGAYAALDFVGDYASAHIYCGYIMLYRRGPSSYEIVREEQNIFHRGDGSADLSQVSQMRAAFCRGT